MLSDAVSDLCATRIYGNTGARLQARWSGGDLREFSSSCTSALSGLSTISQVFMIIVKYPVSQIIFPMCISRAISLGSWGTHLCKKGLINPRTCTACQTPLGPKKGLGTQAESGFLQASDVLRKGCKRGPTLTRASAGVSDVSQRGMRFRAASFAFPKATRCWVITRRLKLDAPARIPHLAGGSCRA